MAMHPQELKMWSLHAFSFKEKCVKYFVQKHSVSLTKEQRYF